MEDNRTSWMKSFRCKMFTYKNRLPKRWLKPTIKIVLFVTFIFWVVSSWFGYLTQPEKKTIMLQKQLKETEEKLDKCAFKEDYEFKLLAQRKPQIPKSLESSFNRLPGRRVVHLDLKGAPPKMSYLLNLLPILKDMGATGLLVEYEDMFPYHGYIRVLSSQNAYSYDDISSLLNTAKTLNMEVIPLIQTLGHFEFVLKHIEYKHLRETKEYANMPCPLHEQTSELVKKMLDQVLALHPDIRTIHLGGDEVFNMKDCSKCKQSNKTKEHLFLHHMIPLLKHLHTVTQNRVKPVIWDDMLRKWSVEDMKIIAPLTDIMVWGYVPQLENYGHFPSDMWLKYGTAFDSIWVASSFKGAIAADNDLVPIMMHMKNHESWIRIMKKIKNKIIGVALTGWARYDHFAVLCELLPASLPALGISLSVLKEGSYKQRGKVLVESILGFSSPVIITKDPFGSWDTGIPNFPGGNVYSLIAELENHKSWYTSTKNRLDSWCNDRQVEENKVSFLHLNEAKNSLYQLIPSFHTFRLKCNNVLQEYFFEDTVKEWIKDKVDVYINLSEQLLVRLNRIKNSIII